MTNLSDYSKFDNLKEDESDDDETSHLKSLTERTQEKTRNIANAPSPSQSQQENKAATSAHVGPMTRKSSSIPGRYIFSYNGRTIYEWEQTLEDVTMYVPTPPHTTQIKASQITCQITATKLKLGLKGSPKLFIDETFFSKVNTHDSSWFLDKEESLINIILSKVYKGETWESVLSGNANKVDPMTKQEIQKDLMLERFQEENPGFDFRGATFNGQPPDPRTFMGGVKHF